MTADARDFSGALEAALLSGALPGETDGFDDAARAEAVAFAARAVAVRAPATPSILLESVSGEGVRRRMLLAVVNDDMPFLVDSIADAIGGRGLDIHRLLHPVVSVRRDAEGGLVSLSPAGADGERQESIVYMEIERADARVRRAIVEELGAVLADARAAVADWPAMQSALRTDAEALPDGEGAALLRWLLDRHFTLLGHQIEARDGTVSHAQGILRASGPWLWSAAARDAAIARFEAGAEVPLLSKSDRIATVHRRVALDLLVVPLREGGRITGLSLYCGLWTSAALAASPDKVPVLRRRLAAIEEKYGFSATGHAGKALRHALSLLPHDLIVAIHPASLEVVALTAMSLADRPRPKLVLAPGPLGRHLFAFVWLPREELSTARRVAIGQMLAEAGGGTVQSWSVEIGDGDLAFLRYTLDVPPGGQIPEPGPLDRRIEEMVRGWTPSLEEELATMVGATRASRLAIAWANAFPAGYRNHYGPLEGARDLARLAELDGPEERGVRIYRDVADTLHLKTYRQGESIALSDAVPMLENFGFRVLEEIPTALDGGRQGYLHDFTLELDGDLKPLMARVAVAEAAIAAVLAGAAEDDAFNQLIIAADLAPRDVVLLRAWFRYLRQTGLAYGLDTVVAALRRAPAAARGIIALFDARLDPTAKAGAAEAADKAIDAALADVAAIDDDRILRRFRAVVQAILRTNAFAPAGEEALAFKLESAKVPGLPRPVPWREIWVYAPRVEGIHLRGGPIARGGLRWSDRRDDFRTEILGLMKAQVVKNAVIVPTGAKGGFYPKQLPPASDREAWFAEGTESYRIFIRALLSVTDNIVEGAVVHPDRVTVLDGDDSYFVVAADKGTATFSDVANAIAIERTFWLGDAFASGGSVGYDHKAMGITARGAWISVQRHFSEMGVDVQSQPIRVAGCGDMSGDVFGNGMLLSPSLKLVAAFDHRHFFLDPDPDPARSWQERQRLFDLPRSSWADYDAALISRGGGVFPRAQKAIPLSPEVRAALGIDAVTIDPSGLIAAILKSPVDLLWFGGIGTYIKAADETHAEVGDPGNEAHRVDGRDLRARAIGEGANLGITQAGRIEFAGIGGRINTDFIDNSAGVDCSDNEVNIKIALNREMIEGRLAYDDRNALLAEMTDDVAALVLEDNRLQTLALSLAERGGAAMLPAQVRVIELLEAAGRLDRTVEGLDANQALLRRAQDGRGLTRPELAVLLAHSKLALQQAIEQSNLAEDPTLGDILHAAFPRAMREREADAIDAHRLRPAIIATKIANRVVNRLGIVIPFELAEEEGVPLARIAGSYVAAERIFDLPGLWYAIETAEMPEAGRLALFEHAAGSVRLHIADLIRATGGAGDIRPGEIAATLGPGVARIDQATDTLLRQEARNQAAALTATLAETGAPAALIARIVRLNELDGAAGTAALARRLDVTEICATQAYVRLGEVLGLDWAKAASLRFRSADPWERLLAAGLARDFEQLRLDFIARIGTGDPLNGVESWIEAQDQPIALFRDLIERARRAPAPTAAMLAQIGGQARLLLLR